MRIFGYSLTEYTTGTTMADHSNPHRPSVAQLRQQLTAALGAAFTLDALLHYVAQQREKSIIIVERQDLPTSITGFCVAVQDADLILLHQHLDALLRMMSILHELAHLLFGDVPRFTPGFERISAAKFQQLPDVLPDITRTTIYSEQAEHNAEMLATLLAEQLLKPSVGGEIPALVSDVFPFISTR